MEIRLSIHSEGSPSRAARLTRELQRDLRRQSALRVRPVTRPARSGERAVGVELIGQLAVAFLGGGGAGVALINCLKTYLERDRSLRFKLTRPDGQVIELEGSDLSPDLVQRVIRNLEETGTSQ